MKKSGASQGQPASELISKRIADLGDWRGETLRRMRKLIKEADPDVVEEWKWMGTPIWSHDGILFAPAATFVLWGSRTSSGAACRPRRRAPDRALSRLNLMAL